MRTCIVVLVILGMAGTALAQDLGTSRELPVKNTPIVPYEAPAVPKQGGDTIEDATVIPGLLSLLFIHPPIMHGGSS